MPIFIGFTIALVFFMIGLFIGARITRGPFHGVMVVEETPEGMKYRLELAGDPELLVFEDYITFKVVPPDYEELLSRHKLGV